jgi:hypothetical protein
MAIQTDGNIEKDPAQLEPTIETAEIGDNQVTDAKIASHVSTKITGLPTQTQNIDLGNNSLTSVDRLRSKTNDTLEITCLNTGSSNGIEFYATNAGGTPTLRANIASGSDTPDFDMRCANLDFNANNAKDIGILNLNAATELTISSGAITITQSSHKVDTESDDATDDLDTINGGTAGDILLLRAEDGSRDIVIKNSTGNIICGADFTMDSTSDMALLYFNGTHWLAIALQSNG